MSADIVIPFGEEGLVADIFIFALQTPAFIIIPGGSVRPSRIATGVVAHRGAEANAVRAAVVVVIHADLLSAIARTGFCVEAVERVVEHGQGTTARVGLEFQIAEGVVVIRPHAHVGIGHGGFRKNPRRAIATRYNKTLCQAKHTIPSENITLTN